MRFFAFAGQKVYNLSIVLLKIKKAMVWEVAQYSLWAVMLYVRYSTWIFHLAPDITAKPQSVRRSVCLSRYKTA